MGNFFSRGAVFFFQIFGGGALAAGDKSGKPENNFIAGHIFQLPEKVPRLPLRQRANEIDRAHIA